MPSSDQRVSLERRALYCANQERAEIPGWCYLFRQPISQAQVDSLHLPREGAPMKSRTASNTHSIWLLVGALAGGCTGAIGSNGSGNSGAGTAPPGSSVPTTGSGAGNSSTGSGTTGSGNGTTPTAGGTTGSGNGTTPIAGGGTTSGSTPVASGPRDPGRVTT